MELTKAEEKIMQILWELKKGFIKEILEHFEEPKPAYTTVATIVKILEKKGFVSYKSFGGAYQYYPLESKEEYTEKHLNSVFSKYFKSSIKDVVSFMAENGEMTVADIEEAIDLLNQVKHKKE